MKTSIQEAIENLTRYEPGHEPGLMEADQRGDYLHFIDVMEALAKAAEQSAAPEMTDANQICQVPPDGWYCTRAAGHNGPCAAHPHEPDRELDAGDHASIAQAMASIKSAPSPSEPVPRGTLEDALYVRYLLRNCLVVLARSNATSMAKEVRDYLQTAIQDATGNLEAVATVVNPHPRNTMSWLIEPALPVGTKLYLSPPPTPATGATKSPDPNIEKNRELLLQRSIVGLAKYGVTTADSPIQHKEWLQHALEESLDMANYLQAAINRPEPDAADARKAALQEAAALCNAKFMARGDTGHAREASTARSLRDEILDLINKEGK